jgi:phosphomevalonate kinase
MYTYLRFAQDATALIDSVLYEGKELPKDFDFESFKNKAAALAHREEKRAESAANSTKKSKISESSTKRAEILRSIIGSKTMTANEVAAIYNAGGYEPEFVPTIAFITVLERVMGAKKGEKVVKLKTPGGLEKEAVHKTYTLI